MYLKKNINDVSREIVPPSCLYVLSHGCSCSGKSLLKTKIRDGSSQLGCSQLKSLPSSGFMYKITSVPQKAKISGNGREPP